MMFFGQTAQSQMILGAKGTFSQVFRLRYKKQSFKVFAVFTTCPACCHIPPDKRHHGNIDIGNIIQYESVSTCSVIPIDAIFLFSSNSLCFSLSLACTPQVSSHCLSFPSANLFFPPFEDLTVAFLLPCVKIIKQNVRANISLD